MSTELAYGASHIIIDVSGSSTIKGNYLERCEICSNPIEQCQDHNDDVHSGMGHTQGFH